jgi:hypothetical protein
MEYIMSRWTADFANDPKNDYELVVEILCDGEDAGVIKNGINGLELVWFAHSNDYIIPVDWLSGLVSEAKKKLLR